MDGWHGRILIQWWPDSPWCSQDLPGLMIYGARPENTGLLHHYTTLNYHSVLSGESDAAVDAVFHPSAATPVSAKKHCRQTSYKSPLGQCFLPCMG